MLQEMIAKTMTAGKDNTITQREGSVQGIHLVAKPIGPMCNLIA
jgi:hypothetical protein